MKQPACKHCNEPYSNAVSLAFAITLNKTKNTNQNLQIIAYYSQTKDTKQM